MRSAAFIMRKISFLILSLVFLVSLFAFPTQPGRAAAATRYVAPSGSDASDCSDFSIPCKTIQHAINESNFGDVILVAAGTYTRSVTSASCPSWAHAVICYVDLNLTILGGYSADNWGISDPGNNLTVIDGQNTYRGVAVLGTAGSTTAYLRMEGFTIQNGRAQGYTYFPSDLDALGGGMWMIIASGSLKNMVFKNNQALGLSTGSGDGGEAVGSAMRVETAPPGSNILIQNVTFENNQSFAGSGSGRGGYAFGALFINAPSATIEDTVFSNNYAQGGNSTGSGNGADGMQGDALGAALGIEWSGSVTLRNVTMTGNQVKGGNGGQAAGGGYGGAILVEDTSSFTMSDSYLANNTSTGGNAHKGGNGGAGAIQSQNTNQFTLQRVKLLSNSSTGGSSTDGGDVGPGGGGALYLFATRTTGSYHATLENIIVADNLAQQGLTGRTTTGNGGGGGIIVQGISADIRHATLARNRIASNMVCGQAMVVQPWYLASGQLPSSVTMSDSIIADHTEGASLKVAILVQSASLTFQHGLFSGNTKDTNSNGVPVPAGTFTGLATMVSAASANFVSPGSPNFNYHLRSGSSSENQASGSTMNVDIDNQSRPNGAASDFGADEYWPFSLSAIPHFQSIRLDWAAGISPFIGTHHYEIVVTCPPGANPPDQGSCGQPIHAGSVLNFTLTGLSDLKTYTIQIRAKDASDALIASSTTAAATPPDKIVFLPLIVR